VTNLLNLFRDEDDCPAAPTATISLAVTLGIGVLIALTTFGLFQGASTAPRGLDVAVAVAAFALVPVMVRWPVAAGLALGALAAVSPAATPAATAAALVAARQRRFPAALAVAIVGIAGQAIQGLWRSTSGVSYGWWMLLVTLAYAALVGWGALARARAALLNSLRERARRAEAEQGRRVAEARVAERTRIAREMHDVLAHRLSLVATYAGALEYRPDASPQQVSQAAGVVRAGIHQALDELRAVITVLRDDGDGGDNGDDRDGRPQPALSDVGCLIDESRDAGAAVRLDNRVPTLREVPPATGRTAYRVIQEGLTNARKHAAGQPVVVVLDGSPGEQLVIDVRNPTAVTDRTPSMAGTGTGLVGLTERVHLAGGELDHELTAGGEFRLRAQLPWPT
jgi:signal transduction histidine kinase